MAKIGSPGYRVKVKTVSFVADPGATAGDRLDTPEAARLFIGEMLRREDADVEHFGMIGLDARHRVILWKLLGTGTRVQAPVDPCRVFRSALAVPDVAALIVFHNHPSGDLEPSRDDLGLTRRLVDGASVLGLVIHDHVIAARGLTLSLREVRPRLFEATHATVPVSGEVS